MRDIPVAVFLAAVAVLGAAVACDADISLAAAAAAGSGGLSAVVLMDDAGGGGE